MCIRDRPDSYMGDVIGDLNKRRGRVMGMDPTGDGDQVITAEVPMAEMGSYAIDLRAIDVYKRQGNQRLRPHRARGAADYGGARLQHLPALRDQSAQRGFRLYGVSGEVRLGVPHLYLSLIHI